MSHFLSEALRLADVGLRVHPLRPGTKKPALPRWNDKATTDPAQIRKWFGGKRGYNLGIAMGGGFITLDIDPSRGGEESLKKLVGNRTLPDTATAITGGGGGHRVFRVPYPIGNFTDLLPGIDVKGTGGQIVGEPSRHPVTGLEYVWTRHPSVEIADCPAWLLEMLSRERIDTSADTVRIQRPIAGRIGDIDYLMAELIARFPVNGYGQRNDRMMRAIASLIGRGFDDGLIVAVVGGWWRHFYRQCLIRTSPDRAGREIKATIRSCRSNPRFTIAARDHRSEVSAIRLNERQLGLLDSETDRLGQADSEHNPRDGGDHKRVTLTSRRLSDRLCGSRDERAFVEAIVVHSIHKIETEPGQLIRMTRDQVREIVEARHGIRWNNEQFERLKSKYITRPDQPARIHELLTEVTKGERRPNQAVGTPSEFLPTGINVFLT